MTVCVLLHFVAAAFCCLLCSYLVRKVVIEIKNFLPLLNCYCSSKKERIFLMY